jgi:hypothetical protein
MKLSTKATESLTLVASAVLSLHPRTKLPLDLRAVTCILEPLVSVFSLYSLEIIEFLTIAYRELS